MIALLLAASLLDVGVIAAATADVVTTERALRNPGLREGNPLMQTPEARIGVKTAATAGIVLAAHHLDKRGHRGTARFVRIAAITLWGGVAVNNLIRERQAR